MDVTKALENQLKNIEAKTGRTLAEFKAWVAGSGLIKHGEIRDRLKADYQLGHGDANTLTHFVLGSHGGAPAEGKSSDEVVDDLYSGPKQALRPIHDAVMARIEAMGDFEIAPKKGYVSLRRKKQFAMLGPATATRVELGLNMKGVAGTDRLLEQPPGSMCQYKIKLTDAGEVDDQIAAWIRQAYESAG